MAEAKYPTLSVAVTQDQRAALAARAEDLNLKNPSAAVKIGINLVLDLNPWAWRNVERWAAALHIPPMVVLENIFLGWCAKQDAENEVWGPTGRTLIEFVNDGRGALRGRELYDRLREFYGDEAKREAAAEKRIIPTMSPEPPTTEETTDET